MGRPIFLVVCIYKNGLGLSNQTGTFTPAEVDDTAPKNATTNLTASFTLTCDPPLIAGDEYVIGFGALKRDSPGNYTGLDFKARIFTP